MATGVRVFESFAEGLAHFKVTAGAGAYLEAQSTRLKSLASRIATGENVTPAERTELKSIYTEYSRRALSDRAGLVRAGQVAKSPDEIRSDFFSISLGHLGGKETERIALRTALIREAKEVGGDVTLASGVKVPKAEVDALKAQKGMGFELSFRDQGRLDAILKAEADAEQAAQRVAQTRATRIESRDSGLAHGRQAAAEAGRAIFKQDTELRHSASRLETVYRTHGTMAVEDAFTALRSQLTADPAKLLLLKELDRAHMPAPKDILRAIRDGNPITEREFTDLQTFFHNYDPSMRKGAAAVSSATPGMMPANATAMAMNFGREIINLATREGNAAASPMRLRALYETGAEPNLFRRSVAGVAESPLARRALVGTGLVAVLALPALHLTTNYLDPHDYGPAGTSAFTALHQNWMSPSELKKVESVTEVTSNLYFRMVTGGGFSNPMFIQYTKDLTGVSLLAPAKDADGKEILDANGKKTYALDPDFKAGSDKILYRLLEIANKLPSDVVAGYNTDGVEAYKYALAKFSGMPIDQYKGNQSITEHLTKKIAENIASRMTTDPSLRTEKLTAFFGTADLSQTDLVKKFAGSNNPDAILRSTIGNYLVLQGILKPEELTVEALKTKTNTLIEQEAKQVKVQADSDLQSAANNIADEMAENTRQITQPRGNATPSRSPESVKGMFNKMAADEDYAELKGTGNQLGAIYDRSGGSAAKFEQELRKELPSMPPQTVKLLRDMAYEPSR